MTFLTVYLLCYTLASLSGLASNKLMHDHIECMKLLGLPDHLHAANAAGGSHTLLSTFNWNFVLKVPL